MSSTKRQVASGATSSTAKASGPASSQEARGEDAGPPGLALVPSNEDAAGHRTIMFQTYFGERRGLSEWRDLDSHSVAALEEAIDSGARSLRLPWHWQTQSDEERIDMYEFDLVAMVQKNLSSGATRPLRHMRILAEGEKEWQ